MYFFLKSLKFIYIIPLYAVTTQQDWRTQRTKHHTGPETACAADSSWWWTQWCPKHVERNNVNKFYKDFKTKYI